MKTKHNTIASITTAAIALIASAVTAHAAHAANRTLILLQENSNGTSYLEDILPDVPARAAADLIIDSFVEDSETAKFRQLATSVPFGQSSAPYQRFIDLSDTRCTRTRLLNNLIAETNAGRTVDLAVLGHGSNEYLGLNDGDSLTGATGSPFTLEPIPGSFPPRFRVVNTFDPGTIRSLLTEARAREGANFNFKLRLVYMCNCFGSTLNDDWLAIGAKTSVGSLHNDYMPEPMITNFWNDFVLNDKRAALSASDTFATASLLYTPVPTYLTLDPETGLNKIQDSRLVTLGNGNLIFKDEFQMAVGDSRNITVNANQTHKFPIYTSAGESYTFSAGSTDTWINGNALFSTTSNANGYTPGLFDGGRRVSSAKMMALCGERFTHPDSNPFNFIGGSGFKIGTSLTHNAGYGFLNLFANDVILGYGDNHGSISVTVRRTR